MMIRTIEILSTHSGVETGRNMEKERVLFVELAGFAGDFLPFCVEKIRVSQS